MKAQSQKLNAIAHESSPKSKSAKVKAASKKPLLGKGLQSGFLRTAFFPPASIPGFCHWGGGDATQLVERSRGALEMGIMRKTRPAHRRSQVVTPKFHRADSAGGGVYSTEGVDLELGEEASGGGVVDGQLLLIERGAAMARQWVTRRVVETAKCGIDFDFCLSTSIPVLTTSTYVVAWPQGDQFLGGGP